MSIYKRIGSLILSLLLVFSMFGSTFAIQTFAATTTVLSTESKSVSAGEQFTVAVNLSNATSVYDGNFTLQYDNDLLTADSYSFGSIISEHNKSCNLNYQSAGNLIRMTFYGTSSISANGTLVTITFTAKENVSGTAALQFTNYKMYDLNGSSVTTTANGSNITITGEPVISPTISVANKTVTVGDTFSVPVLIGDSESVYDGNFTLQYDSDLLTVNSYSYGSVVDSHNKNCNLDYQSSGNLIRFTFNGTSALSSDGTLVTFNFTAKSEGTAALKFTEYKMYDKDGSSISTTISNANITVKPLNDNIVTGQCGDDVYYELDINSGELIISGTGDMWDFTTFNAPWYENYADSIKTIEIQDSVTTIGSAAFSYCYYLTDVKFGNGLKHIGSGAFSHSSSLSSVVLPYGIESVGDWAFEYCNDLSEIVLPDTIKSIGEDICDVTSFHSNDANWTGDVLYIGKHLVDTKFPYTGECIIKDGTLTIADGVFHQSNLTSVIIPNSVTYIGESAFSCTELTSVTIPSNVKEIKTNTFYHCLSLERVTITYGTEIIGSSAFYYCPALTTITIPISVTYIGESAFVLCENLKTVVYNGSQYGSQEEWNLIEICENNDELLKVKPQTVTKVIDSMEINSNPEKSTYYIGDSLSTSGLKLLVTYSDGTTETITSGFTTSGFSSTAAGTKTVTVSYEGFTDTFTVTVKTPSITLSSSSKTMSIGDASTIMATTTPSGQTVIWTSSNTSVATVSGGKITAKASGSTTITAKFTYNGKTYSKTCSVTVEDVPVPPTPESLSVSTKPTKTTYEIGESLNTSGLKLKLTYSDGTYETITSGFTTSGFSSTTTGTKTVTVKYNGLTTTFTVTVTSTPDPTPTSLSVSTKPTKTTYEIGESLNTSGLKLKQTYSDGTTETITSGFTTSGFSSTTAGTKTVTVKYGSLTTTFTVTVNAPTPIDGPRVTVESKKARVGSTVLITVSLEENPGIWGMDLVVNYDKTQLTLTSVTNGTVFSLSEWTQGNLSGDKYILSYEASGFDNITTNGVLATLEFTVNENATVDSFASISLSYNAGDIINVSFDDINVAIVSGGINITDFVYGDLNSDGLVNKKDSLLMKMYLADNSTTIDMQAADVYVDGSINKKDSLYLKQYLAGLDVELGA